MLKNDKVLSAIKTQQKPTMKIYIEIKPSTSAYIEICRQAVVSQDQNLNAKIRDNIGKPIHLVNQWFLYHIMTLGTHDDHIIIYDQEGNIQFRQILNTFLHP